MAENQGVEMGRDDRRLQALRARREQREALQGNQKEELEITIANRRVSCRQTCVMVWFTQGKTFHV